MTSIDFSDLDDDALLARLASVTRRVDPVPAGVAAAARDSFDWRDLDRELAELVFDSAVDRDLAGVRSDDDSRQLTFEGAGLAVEMEVSAGRGLVGQIVPPQPGRVEIRHRRATQVVHADHLGRFSGELGAGGPVSLVFRPEAGTAVSTDWHVL